MLSLVGQHQLVDRQITRISRHKHSATGWRDLNPRPPAPQANGDGFESKLRQRVAKRRSRRGSSGGSSSTEIEHDKAVGESLPSKPDSFSAALAMIASLPLSDAEKADAVRRLMAERVG